MLAGKSDILSKQGLRPVLARNIDIESFCLSKGSAEGRQRKKNARNKVAWLGHAEDGVDWESGGTR